ncbi:hypothetical protein DYI95_002555 [Thermaerobacter sp. PB12/4term]|uniref:hypothetical protein n=1 Tax=Thermaerobacter sp. PB12/4term TaxID=2293838 RepID=UPI0011C03B3F|nr:hypothetical protein [Thermaerobacter sp. PB12/4term]QIA26561.1 hypothetical protein DYI95_002555 [Thermaerobacter sp. PB12/4term]
MAGKRLNGHSRPGGAGRAGAEPGRAAAGTRGTGKAEGEEEPAGVPDGGEREAVAAGGGGAGGAVWNAVQAPLHEIVDLARDLERHLEGAHGARAHRLRQLAEEVVARLRPGEE